MLDVSDVRVTCGVYVRGVCVVCVCLCCVGCVGRVEGVVCVLAVCVGYLWCVYSV